MPRGPRRGGTAERRIARKTQRTLLQTHGGYQGPSIIESLETELLEATIRYLEAKEGPGPTASARGVMRGLAIAVAVWRNMYDQDIKGVEKEFVRLAKVEVTKE